MDDSAIYEEVISDFMHPDKQLQKQMNVIEELLTTERSYAGLLQVCGTDIRQHLESKQLGLDLDGLFLNTEEVQRLASELVTQLEAVSGKPDQILLISNVFLTYKPQLEETYKEYCVNYPNTILLESIYKKDEKIRTEISETLKTFEHLIGTCQTRELSFFLVKPVQRIGKYPLLLKSLLESTPTSDEGYMALEKATRAMEEINHNINEYKRRKEVASKYGKMETLSIRDKLNRINKHSIAKKASRLSRVIKHETGILPKVEDKDYNDLVETFNMLEKCVAALKESTANYITNLEHFHSLRPYRGPFELVKEHHTLCYQEFVNSLHQQTIPGFKERLQTMVHKPLCLLQTLFARPQQLMRKHYDKMLDYEKIQEKLREESSVSYEEKAESQTYQAIHSLLLTELPRFNTIVIQLLTQILQATLAIHRDMASSTLQLTNQHLHQFPLSDAALRGFWQQTEETLQASNTKLSKFIETFDSNKEYLAEEPLSPLAERTLEKLIKKYSPEKIYQLTSNVSGSRNMELSLHRGDFVALLQARDTKQNKNRWLMDTGGQRGYVPAGKLRPYQTPTQPNSFLSATCSAPGDVDQRIRSRSCSFLEPPVLPLIPATQYQVFAAYEFIARGPNEVTLQQGQMVTVLEAHDKRGTNDWWLVKVNGRQGYAPSNHLVTRPVTGAGNPVGYNFHSQRPSI
uniref:Rho guanine nucleotide exchange factor 37 n=1 Tax=Callorhinchus milii TaxID=7868 RepID=A0A4W3KJA4_CALMI|eukprot:gi/632975770/ref/XP_007904414.1/ PREDICTED: rho guanine nucleotide exchange factor 37 [Callorhinchus milii]